MIITDWLHLEVELNSWQVKLILEKIEQSVAAERKACVQVCLDQKWHGDWSDCADAISARGNK